MTSLSTLYKVDSTGKVRVYFIEVDGPDYRMVTGVKDGAMVRSKWTTATGKNLGKTNETSPEVQAILEAESKYTKKEAEGYYYSEEEALNSPDGKFFEPMLAEVWEKVDEKHRTFPLLIDPKLDGMRMTTDGIQSISRKGKHIPTVPHIIEEVRLLLKDTPTIRLDGEIYNHEFREDFNTLMSIARKSKPDQEDLKLSESKLQFHVYDMFDSDQPLMSAFQRKVWLAENLINTKYIKVVPVEVVCDMYSLEELKHLHIQLGYEGSISRKMDSLYQNKRTKDLLKIKSFITEEFPIIEIEQGKGNKSDIAGAIAVDFNGVRVGCGIRGSWKYCAEIYSNKDELVGATATIRHFGVTPDKSLRFPVCIDINRPD